MRAMLWVATRLRVRLRVMEPRGVPLGWAWARRRGESGEVLEGCGWGGEAGVRDEGDADLL